MAEKLSVTIDNRGGNTVVNALKRLLRNLEKMDVTAGVFEVGSFLLLERLWRDLSRVRILMGDETTRRTKREIVQGLREQSNASTEQEKMLWIDFLLFARPLPRRRLAFASILGPSSTPSVT